MSAAGELAMFLAMGAAAVGLLFGPIGSAIARRIAGRSDPGDARADLEELRVEMSAEVQTVRNRLAELEERLDFAERLLTRGQEIPK